MPKNKFLRLTVGIIIVLSVALFTLNLDPYAEKISQIATNKARMLGIDLQFERPHISFLSFEASKIGIVYPKAMSAIVLDNVTVDLDTTALLSWQPKIRFKSEAYGGKLGGTALLNNAGLPPKIEISGHSIDLGKHTQFAALGISGELNITDSWVDLGSPAQPQAEAHLTIKNGKKPMPTQVDLTPFGAPFTITVPPIQWFSLGIDGTASGDKIQDLEFSLASSLGSINGTGTLFLSPRKLINRVSLKVKVALTEPGKREFGAMLSLASGGAINSKSSEFTITFEGPAMRPEIQYSDIQ